MQGYGNYVNGNFTKARLDFPKFDPTTEEEIAFFPMSRKDEIDEAVEAARWAFPNWRAVSRVKRGELFDNLAQIIKSRKEEIASVISHETGKSVNESMAEVIEALHMVQFTSGKGREPYGEVIASEIADRDCTVIRKPKGVVAVVAPWNFPFAIPGAWTTAPALLEGNTVVLKPSEDTPLTGHMIAELYHQAGFPAGVFNLIHGDGEVGGYLARHRHVAHICFTGSYAVARMIRQACADSKHRTCSCETGSKSAVIVFDDADLDLAAQAAVNSAFKLSGQRCVSSGRILVQRDVLNKFIDRFLPQVKQVSVQGPFEPADGLTMGPLINKAQMERVMVFNEEVRNDEEAKVLWDQDGIHGRLPRKGYFLRPFVYKCEWRDKAYLKSEVFGPHVALVPFDEINDAINIHNDTDYGLAVGVITEDFRKMKILREALDYGMMYVNLGSIGAESHFPFGGVKNSGYGWASAAATFDAVTHKVTVSVNHGRLNFPQGLK
jgi:aldehyde dehydrogenase (NAD+)